MPELIFSSKNIYFLERIFSRKNSFYKVYFLDSKLSKVAPSIYQPRIASKSFFFTFFSGSFFSAFVRFLTDFGSPAGAQNSLKSAKNPEKSQFGRSFLQLSVSAPIFDQFSSDFRCFLHQFLKDISNIISPVFRIEISLGISFFS